MRLQKPNELVQCASFTTTLLTHALYIISTNQHERERDNEVFMYYVDKFDVIFCAVDHYSRNTYICIISLEETDNGIVNFPDHRFLRHTNYIRQISTEILLSTVNAQFFFVLLLYHNKLFKPIQIHPRCHNYWEIFLPIDARETKSH